jgi:hypothetical protein
VRQGRRFPRFSRTILLAVALGFAPGCTALDDYLPGTPFTPDQPEGEVTVVGPINADRIEQSTEKCAGGGTLFWGTARNTGDLDLNDVFIVVDAYGPAGALLGSFRTEVFNGEVVEASDTAATGADAAATDATATDIASTSLDVDQSGTFDICTSLPYGSVARTEYHTGFTVVVLEEENP